MQNYILLLLLAFSGILSAKEVILQSPNKKISLTITVEKTINFSVSYNDKVLIKHAKPSLVVNNIDLDGNVKHLSNISETEVNNVLKPIVKIKSAKVEEHYQQATLAYLNDYAIDFRVYNNGVAYRFRTEFDGDVIVNDETLALSFTTDATTHFPKEKGFYSHNERSYIESLLSEKTANDLASLPMMVSDNAYRIVLTETDLRDYPGMWFTGGNGSTLTASFPNAVAKSVLKANSDRNEIIEKRHQYLAETAGKRSYPWRIFAMSDNDADLITNQLPFLLSQENQIADPSWIKPGKVAWDWWNANNLYGVNFKAGINTETYKYYIDFAASQGLEYIIMDEGWYPLGKPLSIVPDINLKEIVAYGETKGVGVILWVIWESLGQDIDGILAQYAQWGAKGVKVDFMQRDDQAMVNYYWDVAEKAAKHKLLVNFHGAYKPAGLHRTYPNVITREGVRGLEHNKWADYITPKHNLTLPFIRMLAGPMDYTPGAMLNAQAENFKHIFNRPMSMTTRAHQVAMFVVFESPLQMLADSPSNYLSELESTQFIAKIPTVWDETLVLNAKLGEKLALVRRAGDTWYVGVMAGNEGFELPLDFTFLPSGNFSIETFSDGINANNYASDYQHSKGKVTKATKKMVTLANGGGWVAIIKPVTKD